MNRKHLTLRKEKVNVLSNKVEQQMKCFEMIFLFNLSLLPIRVFRGDLKEFWGEIVHVFHFIIDGIFTGNEWESFYQFHLTFAFYLTVFVICHFLANKLFRERKGIEILRNGTMEKTRTLYIVKVYMISTILSTEMFID